MELATIFLIWLAITAIDNMTKRKKRRLPPPQNDSPDFEIPTLPGDPNSGEEIPIFIEQPRPAEVQPLNPPPQNDSPDFEIPTLPGDPNSGEEIPIFIEQPRPAEVQPLNPPPRPKKIPAQVREAEERNEFDLNLTPSKVLNAFVLTELLDKPKALRRRRF